MFIEITDEKNILYSDLIKDKKELYCLTLPESKCKVKKKNNRKILL